MTRSLYASALLASALLGSGAALGAEQLATSEEVRTVLELRTAVGSVLPLTEARAAHRMLAGTVAHKPGKIVLQVA
jgi:hypothetical protein